MKNNKLQKIRISLSKEHEKYLPEVKAALKGFDVHYTGGLMRFGVGDFAMQVTIFLTGAFAGGIAYDLLKAGIKRIFKKFKTPYIVIRGNDSVMYAIRPDMTVNVIVTPDRWKEFEKIKSFDDLVSHLQSNNMPTGWRHVRLGEIFEFKNGVNSEGANFGSGIRFINIMEVIRNDFLKAEKIPGRITINKKDINNNIVKYGDVLFNRTSETPGEVGLTSVYLDTEPVVFGGFVIRAREKEKNLDDNYKKYCFSSEQIRREIVRRCQGVVRGNIGQGDLEKIPFIIPSIPEQKRIASILETWDRAITKLDRKIRIKESSKKSLMGNLLMGKVRLAGFSEKWESMRLGDIAKMSSGGTPKSTTPEYYGGDIPWVSIADMTKNGKYLFKTEKNLTKSGLENSAARMYPKGTILYAIYASIGECSIAGVKMSSSQAILGISPNKNKLDSIFLYFYLVLLKEKIKLQGQQGTQSNLNAGMVRDFKIKLPKIEEQLAIVNILTIADEEIKSLEEKLVILKDQKKYLLNNLVTGKIRTPEKLSVK